MKYYRKTSHTVFDVKVHIVWITKYRKRVLYGQVAERARELIREVCRGHEVEIISGHVGKEHVHLLVSLPPYISISKLVQYIKGKSSRKLLQEFKLLSKQFWGQHLWGRGYFVASSGNVTDEVIKEYIESQDEGETFNNDDSFDIEQS